MAVEITKTAPKDYFRSLNPETYRRAYKQGMSFSALVERELRDDDYKGELDGFERLMQAAGIRATSIPEMGVHADTFEKFFESEQARMLLPEWVARVRRMVAIGRKVSTRTLYSSQDAVASSVTNATQFAAQGRVDNQLAAAIPLSRLIGFTTGINAGSYEAFYLTVDGPGVRKVRVVEGTEVPAAKLTGGDHVIKLKKFGRRLDWTDESVRRQRIDRIALIIQLMAVQDEVDKVAAVIDVMVNGDGNSSTGATSYNLTTLDSAATAGTLSIKGWLAFKKKFKNPYMITAALMQDAIATQLELLNAGSANLPMVAYAQQTGGYVAGLEPINQTGMGTPYGWTDDAPANKIVASDTRIAVERVYEIGANMQEVERCAKSQVSSLVMTEVEAYIVFNQGATKILVVNA